MKNDINHCEALEEAIAILDTLYEEGNPCILPDELSVKLSIKIGITISDPSYDMFRNELHKLNPSSDIFKDTTASSYSGNSKKVVHNPPMTSISKASHEDRPTQEKVLEKWIQDINSEIGYKVELSQSYKLDGVAISLYYENGVLKKAGLRPRDGVNGEDVTDQVKFVDSIPQRLNHNITCSIRGELICYLSDFEKVQKELQSKGEELRKNPRNHVAGGIRQFKEPEKVKDMRISFIGYCIEGFDNQMYKSEIERAKWANLYLGIKFIQHRPYSFEDLQIMEDNLKNLDYEVDGVVLSVNTLEDQEQLGRTGDPKTGNPKGKLAWKFSEERAFPVIENIEWKTGRTGSITPVAVFDKPVKLAGTDVSRSALHNVGFMLRNKISIGTKVILIKAGKIIPKIIGISEGEISNPDFPKTCPSCHSDTKLNHTPATKSQEDMYDLVCENKNCPSKNISKILHFTDTIGMLGLGESKIAQLMEYGLVINPSCLFQIDENEVMVCAKFTPRQAVLVIASIYMVQSPEKYTDFEIKKILTNIRKISVPFWKFFAALGIESAGKSAGKSIIDRFRTVDAFLKATEEELSSIEGIGVPTAKIIKQSLIDNNEEIERLLRYIDIEIPKDGKLTGQIFCLSGGFDDGKSHWEKLIEDAGGKCSSSVNKKTSYLVAGPGSGSKSDKAKEIGVKTISVEELKALL